MIDRRTLTFGLSTSALVASQTRLGASDKIEITLAHGQPSNHPVHEGLLAARRHLEEQSKGALRLRISPNHELGTGAKLLQMTAAGTLDACSYIIATAVDAVGIDPLFTVFDAPYVARDWSHMRRITESNWAATRFETLAQRSGLRKVGPAWSYGTRHVTTSTRVIRQPKDFDGLLIRTPNNLPIYEELFRSFGARPVPITFPDMLPKLASREIEGQENPLPTIFATKLHELQKHVTLTGHTVNPYFVFLSEARRRTLSPAQRDMLAAAMAVGSQVNDTLFAQQEANLRGRLQDLGMVFHEIDREALRKLAAPVHRSYSSRWGEETLDMMSRL
jgi:TRAP-type transport system periplasmic protein